MSLRMSILGLVSYKEMTGYDIYKLFDSSLRFFFSAQQSQIYRELKALKAEGYVKERRDRQENRPVRNLIAITGEGKKALEEWLFNYSEEPHFAQRLPYMSKVFFSAAIPDEALLESVKRFRRLALEKLEKLKHTYENADDLLIPYEVPRDDFFYWELTVDYGIRIFTMYIEWADKSIELLEQRIRNASSLEK